MYTPHHRDRDPLSVSYHTGLFRLMLELRALKQCAACGATYEDDMADEVIEEAWGRRAAGDPVFAGLMFVRIRAEVERICSGFGGHRGCWS